MRTSADVRQPGERRRHRVGGDDLGLLPEALRGHPQGERRAERVGVGVLVADDRDPGGAADRLGDGLPAHVRPLVCDLVEEAQHAVPRLDRVVVADDELRDVADRQPPAELAAQPRGGIGQRLQRCRLLVGACRGR